MRNCATPTIRFETPTNLALEVAFDGGKLTSDGGLTWFSRVDSELGLCEKNSRACAGVAHGEGASLARSAPQAARLSRIYAS